MAKTAAQPAETQTLPPAFDQSLSNESQAAKPETPAKKKSTYKPKPKAEQSNRICITLDKPKDPLHGSEICAKANNVMRRLGINQTFFYSEKKAMYAVGDVMFKYLPDRGEWFDLDFLGRPMEQSAEDYWKAKRDEA